VVDPDRRPEGLPTSLPEPAVLPVAGLQMVGRYLAADLDSRAGGDFFEVFPLCEERTAVIIGDIAGHGRAAAEASERVKALVRAVAEQAGGPAAVLAAVEAELLGNGTTPTMVTLLCAEIDTRRDVLTMASAGHCWPVHRQASGIVVRLREPPAPPLGVALLSAASPPVEWTLPFEVGDLVVLFTDGLVERRRTPLDAVLGRVDDAVAEHPDPERLCAELLAIATTDRDNHDDVAVMIIRRPAGDQDDRIHVLQERV
jgi:serine phosphatase RsbU (regulator of sigma subunit)